MPPTDAAVESFLALLGARRAPRTLDAYRRDLTDFSSFLGRPPTSATTDEVQAWLAELHRSNLSPNTVAKAYRCLSGAMDGAVDAGLIARSPCTFTGAGTERHVEMQIPLDRRRAEPKRQKLARWWRQ
jgi:site-specific recombinase XerD